MTRQARLSSPWKWRKSDERFLSLSSTRIAVSEASSPILSVTAEDNGDFADIGPISITLRVTAAGDTRLTPTETVTVTIENDDVYAIGFDREMITLEEGMSATVRAEH